MHGRFSDPVSWGSDFIQVGEIKIGVSNFDDPAEVPRSQYGVDIVVECTGKFKSRSVLLSLCSDNVKKIVVAALIQDADLNIVIGVNDHLYEPDNHKIITAASCTTNCLAPVIKVVQESIGIRHGLITSIHDITDTQVVVDAPAKI